MPKLVLILLAAFAIGMTTNLRADVPTSAGQDISATIGGGVKNPWRSPYKTALMETANGPSVSMY